MSYTSKTNLRRQFLKQAGLAGAALVLPNMLEAKPKIEKGARILFQGDSITDGNRTRNNDWNHVLGHGYAYLAASRLTFDYPDQNFHFFNRGISGNKVTDLTERWQKDTLDLKPDVLSILIGVNDTGTAIGGNTGFTAQSYESGYRDLLSKTKANLPNIKLVICEPFILPVGKVKEKWEVWQAAIAERQAIAKKLATEFNAVFVPFQQYFNAALSKAPAEYWIWDGIHPMPAGHELMSRQWIKAANKAYKLF